MSRNAREDVVDRGTFCSPFAENRPSKTRTHFSPVDAVNQATSRNTSQQPYAVRVIIWHYVYLCKNYLVI